MTAADAGRLDRVLASPWLPRLALGWVALLAVSVLARPCPLGNDEAQYALGARALVAADADAYPLFRSVGMRVLAAPGVAAGGGEVLVRAPFVLIALGYLALVAVVARGWAGPDPIRRRAAGLAVLLHAGAAPWLVRTTEALSDIVAAGTLLAITFLVTLDGERPRARPAAWLAIAALGALVVHVRYGAAPVVAAILAGAALVYPARRRAAALAALATAALLLPFLAWSHARTGSPLGVLAISGDAAGTAYPGAGLVYYLTRWPWALAGPVMGAVAALGVVAGARAWRPRGAADAAGRVHRLVALVALAQLVGLGLRAHGEPRYVFFAMTALAIVGAGRVALAPPRWRAPVAALALASVLASVAIVHVRHGRHQRLHGPLAAASTHLGRDAAGRRCLALTGTRPQVAWYSGCRTELIGSPPPPPPAAAGVDRVYLLSAARAPRQPGPPTDPGWHLLACTASWCTWVADPDR